MKFLYSIAVWLSGVLLPILPAFNSKISLFVKGRKNWKQKLSEAIPSGKKVAWFHAASLGEFEQGRPLIERIRWQHPDYFIIITFFSPSGYEIRKNYKNADFITYLPIDTPGNVRFFLDTVKPSLVFFIKYEFWYNFLRELKRRNTPVYLVSGIFRPDHIFFRWFGSWFRKQLGNFTFFFVQNKKSLDLLQSIGLNNAIITGDTRFDTVAGAAASVKPIDIVEAFTRGQKCLVAGSTWPEDEVLLTALINEASDDIKFIIAPHEIHEKHIENIVALLKKDFILFSAATPGNVAGKQILIIDNIGMLLRIYSYATLAYVGGGFGKGIHNILEPAAFGAPVITGPNYRKFQEAVDLTSLGGAFPINNFQELEAAFRKIIRDPLPFSTIVKNYVEARTGATEAIMKKVVEEFKD